MAITSAFVGDASQFARRALIVTQELPVPFDRHVWQEAMTLTEHGYIVSVICPKGKGCDASYELINNVHIFRHPKTSGSLLWQMMLACRIFFTLGFDVIHICNPPDSIVFLGSFFKLFFSKKLLFEQRSLGPELHEQQSQMHKIALWFERVNFKLADVGIVANESYRKIAIERGKVSPQKLFVVRPAPALDHIKPASAIPSLKQGRKYLVAYVGNMNKQAGIPHLIEAARIIVQDMKRDDVHFTLAGDGPMLERLRKLVAMQGVVEHVTFTGLLSDKEMLELLSTADVCVEPREVNPATDKFTASKIMEYMALGKPVVQFDTTEGRITAGEAALYAKPNDTQDLTQKITALLDDPAKRKEIGTSGRARMESKLSWAFEVPKLLAAYDALFEIPKKD